jgi:hypothetical protein
VYQRHAVTERRQHVSRDGESIGVSIESHQASSATRALENRPSVAAEADGRVAIDAAWLGSLYKEFQYFRDQDRIVPVSYVFGLWRHFEPRRPLFGRGGLKSIFSPMIA